MKRISIVDYVNYRLIKRETTIHYHNDTRICVNSCVIETMETHIDDGVAFWNQNKNRKAKECFQKIIDHNKTSKVKSTVLANAYHYLGRIAEEEVAVSKARRYYEKSCNLNDNLWDAHYNLGKLLKDMLGSLKFTDTFNKSM